MSEEPIDVSQAYLHFGRHTEAGKMIFALYSAQQNRKSYKPNLKIRTVSNPVDPHEQHMQSLKQMPKRVAVKVPKPIKRRGEQQPRFPVYGGRKPAELIFRETKEMFSKDQMQAPKSFAVKPRSDVIADLQVKFSGECQSGDNQKPVRDYPIYNSKQSINEAMISQLFQEVEERQQFLKQMQSLDKKTFERVAPGIEAEIRMRVDEIHELSQHK